MTLQEEFDLLPASDKVAVNLYLSIKRSKVQIPGMSLKNQDLKKFTENRTEEYDYKITK